ncbi:MAG TPA: gliding motility-associated C-terminal domain-containing protein [Bacteroidia bacterium]|jgi:gliding motility-associated-like protein|nr:gliding motility-associated C-terminal domain-containing protein [Bacteroidia bacterium]
MQNSYKRLASVTFLTCSLFFATTGFSQHTAKAKWSVQKPFEQYGFIENKGQFPQNVHNIIKDNILYYTKKGKIKLYFTPSSLVYKYDSLVQDNDGKDNKEIDRAKSKLVPHSFNISWEGANPNPKVEVQNELSNYYTFPNPADKSGKTGIKANAWSKLIYHNLYTGIDLEFYYPKDKGGIEYDVIVHPGADISAFKMKYNGATVKLSDNNVIITAPFGIFTDHAPSTSTASGINVSSAFKVNSNIVSFNIGSYDKSKLLTIDPWTTSVLLTGNDGAYDLDYDNQGNVYICGGGDFSEYQIMKFNSTGVVQWTYTATFVYSYGGGYYLYSDLAVDHRNGTSYFAEGGDLGATGCQVLKINNAGIQYGLFAGNPGLQEMWRLALDYCTNTLVIAAGNPTPNTTQACTLDTALTTLNAVNVLGAFDSFHDMALLAIDGSGNAYMATTSTFAGTFGNELMRLPIPSLSPTAYLNPDGHNFYEIESIAYYPSIGFPNYAGNGFNGMAVNKNMLLTYDGKELKKWRPSNGAYVDSISVSSTYFNWGGLDIDCSGNIYAGNNMNVNIYDSTLTPILTPISFTNTIYDLKLNGQGTLFVCGQGFVASDTISSTKLASVTYTEPSRCTKCNGSATASGCGQGFLSYKWSTGATTQTITNLCDGSYTVTVKDSTCGLVRKDTAVVFLGIPGYYPTLSQVNPTCTKLTGSASVVVTGGTTPYTYSWSNGSTNATDTGLVAGTYTLIVTDFDTCKLWATVTLFPPPPPPIKITPAVDSICPGGNIGLVASGGVSYVWSASPSLSCSTCPNPTATPGSATTYTVTGTDAGGCTNTATAVITIAKLPVISIIPPKDSICPGGSANLTASGAVSYVWSPSATLSCSTCASTVASPAAKTTYTVTGTNALGCSSTATVTITINPTPTITVIPASDSICPGSSTSPLVASGGVTYTWSPSSSLSCGACPNPTANPGATTTYTVTGSNGSCTSQATVVVKVLPSPVITITPPLIICEGKNTTLTATGGGTYSWNTGATSASILVNPSVASTYSVTVTGPNGCTSTASTAVGVDIPTLTACCDTSIIKGTTVQLTTTGNVVGFVWTPGSGLSCFSCADPKANPTSNTTYTVTGTDANGCVITATVTIDMKCFDFTIPNVFTPNGDNDNDLFYINIPTIDTYEITIYDRWGKEMYKSSDAYQYWNGKNESGAEAPDGVYYYIIKSTCGSNKYDKQGFVQIIR